ncbi:hypothetical protein RUM43_002801 [Polyplax serrata]|uniref:HIT domain-containing protein n=1 Tax=Polyplax serrata TaxID=468196 RepID=A0AAN8NZ97_POLSC
MFCKRSGGQVAHIHLQLIPVTKRLDGRETGFRPSPSAKAQGPLSQLAESDWNSPGDFEAVSLPTLNAATPAISILPRLPRKFD